MINALKPLAPLVTVLLALAGPARSEPLKLNVVPIPVTSYRLLGMSMDDDGYIWFGAIHRVIHRYDPRTGSLDSLKMPFDSTTSSCIAVGRKVYLLGQSYPKLMVYHRDEKRFTEHAYPSANPNVWYGNVAGDDGRYLYLFDRGAVGLIKWDTHTDTGTVIPWPYKTSLPTGGRYDPRDGALWCYVWRVEGFQYLPIGIARLDPKTDKFTDYFDFPTDDAGTTAEPYTNPDTTFFLPHTLKGKLVPFDFAAKRWCRFVDVPEFGKRFGFLGGPTDHDGKLVFSISTYNGSETGVDGKPYHFCNGVLVFDPRTGAFEFPTLEATDAFYQVAYTLSARGEFYATGVDIRQKDGTLKQTEAGRAVFWQTLKPHKEK